MDSSLLLLILLMAVSIAVVGGLYAVLTTMLRRLRERALTQRGAPVEAVITKLEERKLPRGQRAYLIHYSYGVPGMRGVQLYAGREVVTAEEFRRYRVGVKLWVHYLPDHPETARRTDALARLPGRKLG
jgi:hypothetical protein